MQSVTTTFQDAIESNQQQPVYTILHESGLAQMTWVGVSGVQIHAVAQGDGQVAYLWYDLETNRWETARQTIADAAAGPYSTLLIATGGVADPTGSAGSLTLTHRVQIVETSPGVWVVQALLSHADGAITLINNVGGTMAVRATLPASSIVAGATGWATSPDLWVTGEGIPRIYVINPTKGRLEVVDWTAGTVASEAWDYGTHWTMYQIAPVTVRDTAGRDLIYFTAAAKNGKGRTLYRTSYDPMLQLWTDPAEVFIFDTTNPANGIMHPCVSILDAGWLALTYVKQTGDSDAVVAAQYIAVRLSPSAETIWGPERMVASMNTVAGVAERVTIEPLQPVSVVRDGDFARNAVFWTRQGYYITPITTAWGIPPDGFDITDRFSAFTANASDGLTAGTLNLLNEDPMNTLHPVTRDDLLHVRYGLIGAVGLEDVPIMSAMVDQLKYSEKDNNAGVECRELSARLITAGEQDDATIWEGANHYAYVPSADDYQAFVLPTQLNQALATDTSIVLNDSFRAADSKHAATAAYALTVTPFDECTTAEAARYRIAAPFLPATDVTVEAIFELVKQTTSIDPQPGIYCGADSDGSVYYSLEYRTKQRKIIFAVQRVTLLGTVSRTETVVATIAPGGSGGVYTRVGLRMSRHGDQVTCSYMTQNLPAGTPVWRDFVHTYVDTVDPAGYTLTPMSLSVPGYCGIVAFSEVLAVSEATTSTVYMALWRAYGAKPPLTYAHVIRDAFALGGFDSVMEGFGFLAGQQPSLGLAESPLITGSYPWNYDSATTLAHAGSVAAFVPPDSPTDGVAQIHPVGETAWVSLQGRISPGTASSGIETPQPLIVTGERIGVTLTSALGPVATALGLVEADGPRLWFWYTNGAGTVTTLEVLPLAPWLEGAVAASGYLESARFTLAIQDTLMGVWINNIFAGGVDLEAETLPFPTLRAGRFVLNHAGPAAEPFVYVKELWMSALQNTVGQITVNTQDTLDSWIGKLLTAASVDCAFRANGTFRMVRPDLVRSVDLLLTSRVLDATATSNAYEVLTHVRFLGKNGIYGDAYDIPRFIQAGKRFATFKDETLLTVEQCREAARRKLIEVNRTDTEVDGVVVFDPRMERLDVIRIMVGEIDITAYMADFSIRGTLRDVVTISPGLRRMGVL